MNSKLWRKKVTVSRQGNQNKLEDFEVYISKKDLPEGATIENTRAYDTNGNELEVGNRPLEGFIPVTVDLPADEEYVLYLEINKDEQQTMKNLRPIVG